MRRVALMGLVLAQAVGCAYPRGNYLRREVHAQEIVVLADQRIVFAKKEGNRYRSLDEEALAETIACVPEAQAEFDAADSIQTTGKVMKWIGWAAALSGIALVAVGLARNDRRFFLAGASIGSSGGLLTRTPQYLAPYALVNYMDAANAYNDRFRTTAACGGLPRPRPVVPPALPAPPPAPEAAPGAQPKPSDLTPGGPRF